MTSRTLVARKKKRETSRVEAAASAVVMRFVMNDLINIILHRFPFMKMMEEKRTRHSMLINVSFISTWASSSARALEEQHLCINRTHSRCATSDLRTSQFLPVPITSHHPDDYRTDMNPSSFVAQLRVARDFNLISMNQHELPQLNENVSKNS